MTPRPLICIFEEHSFAHQIELMCINFSLFMLLHKGFRSYFKCLCLFSITLLILPSDCAGAIWDEPPVAGGQLQPQLPHLLPGGGRRPEKRGQGAGHRARAGAGHQGQQWALSLSRTLECTEYRHHFYLQGVPQYCFHFDFCYFDQLLLYQNTKVGWALKIQEICYIVGTRNL